MSIIKCPECGKEISNKAEQCPSCGYPIAPHKGSMKIAVGMIAAICGAIAIFVIISAISDFTVNVGIEEKVSSIPTSSNTDVLCYKYYVGSQDFHTYVLFFNKENSVEIVDTRLGRDSDKRSKAYGTYDLDKRALTIHLSGGGDWNCVVHDNGDSLTVEGVEFNCQPKDKFSDKTLECFD